MFRYAIHNVAECLTGKLLHWLNAAFQDSIPWFDRMAKMIFISYIGLFQPKDVLQECLSYLMWLTPIKERQKPNYKVTKKYY